MRRLSKLALLVVLLVVTAAWADEAALQRVAEGFDLPVTGWRFKVGDDPAWANPSFDASTWQALKKDANFLPEDSTGWCRAEFVVPDSIAGQPLAGTRLLLQVGLDDSGELFINGKQVLSFTWDNGLALLTESAKPGQRFLLALRAHNNKGPGRLLVTRVLVSSLQDAKYKALGLLYSSNLLLALASRGDLDDTAVHRDIKAAFDLIPPLSQGLPAVEKGLEAAGKLLKRNYASKVPDGLVHLIGHAHIDMNWLWLWPETLQLCRTTYSDMLRKMLLFPDFKYSQSTAATYQVLAETDPDLIAGIKQHVKSGQWEIVGGTWVEGNKNMASCESLARHILYAKRFWLENYGIDVTCGWEPDTFGHAWTIPMILSKGGIDTYFFCRCNSSEEPLFWWESPDGSRVLAYNSVGSWYNEQIKPSLPLKFLDFERTHGLAEQMWVYGAGDHGGGPRLSDLETAKALQQMPVGPRFKFDTVKATMASFKAHYGKTAPVFDDELNFTFRGCYISRPEMKQQNRFLENFLPTAEAACFFLQPYGAAYPSTDFARAWENVLFNQHHDPGGGTSIPAAYPYHYGLFAEAHSLGEKALDSALQALAEAAPAPKGVTRVVVFNPLPWPRKDFVSLTLPDSLRGMALIVHDATGKLAPSRLVAPGRLLFEATVPASGFALYSLQVDPARPPLDAPLLEHVLENDFLEVKFDSSGRLLTLLDKRAHRQLVPGGKEFAALEGYLEKPVGNAWDYGKLSPPETLKATKVVTRSTSLGDELVTTYSYSNSTFERTVLLPHDKPWLEVRVHIRWAEHPTKKLGSRLVRIAFSVNLKRPVVRYEIPAGSIERPASPEDVPAQEWAALTTYDTQHIEAPWHQVDLSGFYTSSACAKPGVTTYPTFDHEGFNAPLELLPAAPENRVIEGIPFRLPSATGPNQLEFAHQRIPLDTEAAALYLLVASTLGDHKATLQIHYTDGTVATCEFTVTDWASPPRHTGESPALFTSWRLDETGKRDEIPVHVNLVRVPLPKVGKLESLVLSRDKNLHLFALTAGPGDLRGKARYSIAILNNAKYGHSFNQDCLRISLVRGPFTPGEPDPNEPPTTNDVTFRIYPHTGEWWQQGMLHEAAALNRPLVGLCAAGAGTPSGGASEAALKSGLAKLPGTPLFSLEPDNLGFSALKRCEDDSACIVRFWEAAGRATTARLHFARPLRKAYEVDLVERRLPKGRKISLDSGQLEVQVKPWELLTLKVEFK